MTTIILMSSLAIRYSFIVNRLKVRIFLLVLSFLLLSFLLSLFSSSVYAQSEGLKAPGGSLAADTKIETIPQVVVNYMFLIAAFLAVAYLMYGGIKWITSRGDKIAVESARKHIMAAVMGLIIVAGSFFALNVIFTLLGADNPLKEGFKFQSIKEINDESGN